jgi:polysaccharide deacetylase family protein (PEP-CTERM system associated)
MVRAAEPSASRDNGSSHIADHRLRRGTVHSVDEPRALLLSVDFEDWHQLVRRRAGADNWAQPGPALERQTQALLELLDELNVKATFFVLGMAARSHPELVREIARRGHEVGCHGDEHQPVHSQTPEEFAADLQSARGTLKELTGATPIGYRAPAFSITRAADWAYDVLVEQGFAYDSSQHDSPRIRDRARPASGGPHLLPAGLWEFPVAVWQVGPVRIPVGGASYWAPFPRSLVLSGLERADRFAGLYLHPQELDPQPLDAGVPGARVRTAQRNWARRGAPAMLRAIAERYELIPYGEAHASLSAGAGSQPIQR